VRTDRRFRHLYGDVTFLLPTRVPGSPDARRPTLAGYLRLDDRSMNLSRWLHATYPEASRCTPQHLFLDFVAVDGDPTYYQITAAWQAEVYANFSYWIDMVAARPPHPLLLASEPTDGFVWHYIDEAAIGQFCDDLHMGMRFARAMQMEKGVWAMESAT
jgi:hypothetical protein